MKVNLYYVCQGESIQSCDCKMYEMFFCQTTIYADKILFFHSCQANEKKLMVNLLYSYVYLFMHIII